MAFVDELNKKIAAEKEKQNKLYSQIGEKYVELHKSDAEPALKPLTDEVGGCEQAIKEYKEQIAQIENKSRCPKCGAEVPSGFSFCGNCGTRVKEAPEPVANTEKCPNCGAEIEMGRKFCTECGKPLRAPEPAKPAAPTATEASAEKVCAKCGAKNEADAVFCENCGKKLADENGKKLCPKCGAELEPDSVFCTECGAKV